MHVYSMHMQVNSYQTTIVTNVTRTYAIFSYMCGEIQWSALGRNKAAVVGYNAEGNFFQNHPLSGLSSIGDAVSCTFNIGKRRKRQGQNGNSENVAIPTDESVTGGIDLCLTLERTDKLSYFTTSETPQSLATRLEQCPCTINQVAFDRARFIRLEDDTKDCYVSSEPVDVFLPALGTITLTQLCCYIDG